MSNKFLHVGKIVLILLTISFITAACSGGEVELTDEQVALLETAEANVTETAAAVEAAEAAGDDIPVETIVAQTVEAQNAIATQVQQGIDEALAAQDGEEPTEDANEPDVADPDSDVQQIEPATDPNVSADTPQVRVKVNANVRSGPGTNYPVVGTLAKDTVIPVTAQTTNTAGSVWYLVNIGGSASNLDGKNDSTFKIGLSTEGKQQNVASLQTDPPKTVWIAKSVVDPVDPAKMANVPPAKSEQIPAPPATATATVTTTPTTTPTVVTTGTATGTPTATSESHHTPTPTATTNHTPTPTLTPTTVPSNITINNNSGSHICYVLTAPAGGNYSENHLNGELLNGSGMFITYPNAGPYDLYAQECEGQEDWYWAVYNITNDYTWDLKPGENGP